MKPVLLYIGIVCCIFSMVMGITSVRSAWLNIDGSFPNPVLAAVLLGTTWSGFVLLGIAIMLSSYRYRLRISGDELSQQGIVRFQEADLRNIDRATWRRFPQGGSIRLEGAHGRLKIDFGNLAKADRAAIIDHLRSAIDQQRQEDWTEFEQQCADHRYARDADESQKRSHQQRGRSLSRLGWLFTAISVAFLTVAIMQSKTKFYGAVIVNAAMAVYLFRSASQKPAEPEHPHSEELPGNA